MRTVALAVAACVLVGCTSGSRPDAASDTTARPDALATLPTVSSCTSDDSGQFPLRVDRALMCPDGTEMEVTGSTDSFKDGNVWLCDEISASDLQPCTGAVGGLRLIGTPDPAALTFHGVKQGNVLVLEPDSTIVPHNPCASTDPLTVLTTFVDALRQDEQDVAASCQDTQHPAAGSLGTLSDPSLLLDQAHRVDGFSTSVPSFRVIYDIPFPPQPRDNQPPRVSGVRVTLALQRDGTYVINEVLTYSST